MTGPEAIRKILSRTTIAARVVACDYDPAGSTAAYEPDAEDLAMLGALAGRTVHESELAFSCGGATGARFSVPGELSKEIERHCFALLRSAQTDSGGEDRR